MWDLTRKNGGILNQDFDGDFYGESKGLNQQNYPGKRPQTVRG